MSTYRFVSLAGDWLGDADGATEHRAIGRAFAGPMDEFAPATDGYLTGAFRCHRLGQQFTQGHAPYCHCGECVSNMVQS